MTKKFSRMFKKNKRKRMGIDMRSNCILISFEGKEFLLDYKCEIESNFYGLFELTNNSASNITISLALPEKHLLIKEMNISSSLKPKEVYQTVKLHCEQLWPWSLEDFFWDYFIPNQQLDRDHLFKEQKLTIYAINKEKFISVFEWFTSNNLNIEEIQLASNLISLNHNANILVQIFDGYLTCIILEENMPTKYKNIILNENNSDFSKILSNLNEYLNYKNFKYKLAPRFF